MKQSENQHQQFAARLSELANRVLDLEHRMSMVALLIKKKFPTLTEDEEVKKL